MTLQHRLYVGLAHGPEIILQLGTTCSSSSWPHMILQYGATCRFKTRDYSSVDRFGFLFTLSAHIYHLCSLYAFAQLKYIIVVIIYLLNMLVYTQDI